MKNEATNLSQPDHRLTLSIWQNEAELLSIVSSLNMQNEANFMADGSKIDVHPLQFGRTWA